MEWLVGDEEALEGARRGVGPGLEELDLSVGGSVRGFDVDEMREAMIAKSKEKRAEREIGNGRSRRRRIVLGAVREVGNEGYYLRRGYSRIGIGVLPVGSWGSKVECTSVFMEKEI